MGLVTKAHGRHVKTPSLAKKHMLNHSSLPLTITLHPPPLAPVCRTADESTRWVRFKPFAEGTQWRYQFVPDQKYGLYPQLANAKPFVAAPATIKAITGNKDSKKGPVFQPQRNDYQATYELGAKGSTKRTQYQTDSAWFWAQGANTSTIAGQWLEIARQVGGALEGFRVMA